jgi:hypothetical protein
MAGKRAAKIDAVLRHLAAGEDVASFPGTKYENLAVVRTAVHRGLISWDAEGNRYTLTSAGWSGITPRRFGVRSLVASTAVGAAIGAAALAFVWLPGVKWQLPAQATASSVVEKPVVAAISPPADLGGRSVAPMTSTTAPTAKPISATVPVTTAAAPATTAAAPAPAVAAPAPAPATPAPAAATPVEPPSLAADPSSPPEQPAVQTPPVKQAAVKKPRRKTVRHHEHNPFASPWQTRTTSYPRYGQGSWYAYR